MNHFRELLRHNTSTFLSMALLLVVPLLGSTALLTFFYFYNDLLQHLTLPEALLYFVLITFTMTVALTPTTFVAIITGYYFGWAGFPGMVAAYVGALLLARLLTNRLDHGKLWRFLHRFPKVGAVLDELNRQQLGFIFMSRLSPVLPFALMNFLLSLLQVRKRDYVLGSLLGMLPRTTFFYWLGTQAQELYTLLRNPSGDNREKLLFLGLLIVSVFGMIYYLTRAIQRSMKKAQP